MIRQAVHPFSTLVAATALIAASASAVAAQTPKVDVAGGYAYLHEEDLSVPAGWFASVGGTINDWLDIVGAVSGHYKTEDVSLASVKVNLHTFVAGPRFTSHRNPAFSPYAQVLFGGARTSATAKVGSTSSTNTDSGFDVQPGAGVDIKVNNAFGVRVGVNGDFIRSDGETSGEFQFIAGIVIRR